MIEFLGLKYIKFGDRYFKQPIRYTQHIVLSDESGEWKKVYDVTEATV